MKLGEENGISEGGQPHLVVLSGPGPGDFFAIDADALVPGSAPFEAEGVPVSEALYQAKRSGGNAVRKWPVTYRYVRASARSGSPRPPRRRGRRATEAAL